MYQIRWLWAVPMATSPVGSTTTWLRVPLSRVWVDQTVWVLVPQDEVAFGAHE
jgi:hypothetical protein